MAHQATLAPRTVSAVRTGPLVRPSYGHPESHRTPALAPVRRHAQVAGPPEQAESAESSYWRTIRALFASGAAEPPVELPRRETVYGMLDRDRTVYLVERGIVKAVATSRSGKECLLGIYGRGEVFGELSLICANRTEMVTTMTPTVLRRVPASKVLDALSDSESREEFIRRLVQRLSEQQRLIVDLVTTDSEHCLAAVLLHLGSKLGQREGYLVRIEPRITQEELSAMVGTTRSRVGFFLKRFHDAGLVSRRSGSFLILHEPRIHQFIAGA